MTDASAALLATLRSEPVVGSVALGLVLPAEWIHRRVENVCFATDDLVRRRVSLDLTIGFATPNIGTTDDSRLVPIALLRKRVLRHLDVHGGDGVPLPILTTRQNGELAAAVLQYTVEALAGLSVSGIAPALTTIATRPIEEAMEARKVLLEELRALDDGDPLSSLANGVAFHDFTRQFAENFILAAVVHAPVGHRMVIKFAYDEPTQPDGVGRLRRLAQTMGWDTREFRFDIPAAAATESFHIEIDAPDGVAVSGAALFAQGIDSALPAEDLTDFQPAPVPRAGAAGVHFHARGGESSHAEVYLWLRIARAGWLRSALLATGAVVILTTLNAWRISALVGGGRNLTAAASSRTVSTDVAALLMAVVALVLSFAIRIGEHPVTARTVSGVRVVTVLAAVLPLVDGWLLAFGPSGSGLKIAWWVVAVVSWILFGLVAWAYRGPNSVTPI